MSTVNTDGLNEFNPFISDRPCPPMKETSPNESSTRWTSNESTGLITSQFNDKLRRNSAKLENDTESFIKRENNWPYLPSVCPCQPCFYINIENDIPERMQELVLMGYYIWLSYALVMIFNVLGTLSYFISFKSMESSFTFFCSLLLLFLLPGFGFLLWFRSLYKAVRSDSSMQYFLFFITMFGQIAVIAIQCLGISWLGSCGWMNGLMAFDSNRTTGSIMIFIAIMYLILLIGHLVLLSKVHNLYRNSGIIYECMKTDSDKAMSTGSLRDIATISQKTSSGYIMNGMKGMK